MGSLRSEQGSYSDLLEGIAGSSRGGDRTRSLVIDKSGLHKTGKASINLASTEDRSSVRSTAESEQQETTRSMRSTRDRFALASSRAYDTPQARRIWDELPAWRLEYEALTPIQQQVMEHVAFNSETESAAAKARLEKTWRGFDISEEDFTKIEVYLAKKVPLTIRIDIQGLFPYLMKDPFYRYNAADDLRILVVLRLRQAGE